MAKILVPVDGSETALRAVDRAIGQARAYGAAVELHVMNVQPPLPQMAAHHVSQDNLTRHHQEEGMAALKTALQKLDAAGVKYTHHIVVGDPADTICRFAGDQGIDEIVIGTRGHGAAARMLLGSVATKVAQCAEAPVTLVK